MGVSTKDDVFVLYTNLEREFNGIKSHSFTKISVEVIIVLPLKNLTSDFYVVIS